MTCLLSNIIALSSSFVKSFGTEKIFANVPVKEHGGVKGKEKLTGERRDMTIEEFIMNEHGGQKNFDKMLPVVVLLEVELYH